MPSSTRKQITLQLESSTLAAWQQIVEENRNSPIPSGSNGNILSDVISWLTTNCGKKLSKRKNLSKNSISNIKGSSVPSVSTVILADIRYKKGLIRQLRVQIQELNNKISEAKLSRLKQAKPELKMIGIYMNPATMAEWQDWLSKFPNKSPSEVFTAMIQEYIKG